MCGVDEDLESGALSCHSRILRGSSNLSFFVISTLKGACGAQVVQCVPPLMRTCGTMGVSE